MKQLQSIWPQWEIVELIGKGSYGNVYKIRREELGSISYAALKIIEIPKEKSEIRELMNSGMDSQSVQYYYQDLVKNIQNEIRVMETLKTGNNIVSIEDYSIVKKEEGIGWKVYIRMELLTNLSTYLEERGGTLEPEEVAKIGRDICTALECCEQERIIHRDIKPDNVFRNPYGDYKLGDFGIARQMEMTGSVYSQKGTSLYMAPEVYRGEQYDKTVDIYSLGIMLYKFLNQGRFPFMPPAPELIRAGDAEEAMQKRMSGEPLLPPVNASEYFANIVRKMCAYRPEERYQNPQEIKKALERIIDGKESAGSIAFQTAQTESSRIQDEKEKDINKTWGIWEATKAETDTPEKIEENKKEDESVPVPVTKQAEPKKAKKGKKRMYAIPAAVVLLLLVVFAVVGLGGGKEQASDDTGTTAEESNAEETDQAYLLGGQYLTPNAEDFYPSSEEDLKQVAFEDKEWAVKENYDGSTYQMNLSEVPYKISGIFYPEDMASELNLKILEESYGADTAEAYKALAESVAGKNLLQLSYYDKEDYTYNYYALYEYDGKKLKLEILDSEQVEQNKLQTIGTEEYKCTREGNEVQLSKGGSKITLVPTDLSKAASSFAIDGFVANDKDAYEDIVGIYFSHYADDADNTDNFGSVYFADGHYAIDPEFEYTENEVTISWQQRWGTYNGKTTKVDDPQSLTFEYLLFSRDPMISNPYYSGGVILKKDGKEYRYLSSRKMYEAAKLSGTASESDLSGLDDEKKSELIETQTNILDDLEEAFEAANVNAQVDTSTGQVAMDSSILFALDDAALSEEGKAYLDGFLDVYSTVLLSDDYKNSIAKIKIEGHTDSSGSYEHNVTLSEQRAAAVAEYCTGKVPELASIIETKGYASDQLVYDENGKEDADASRRVAFKFALVVE